MKKFGIYLCYAPTVDLRMEGLGRHMGEFLKAAQERGDISFVIACPSWLRENLDQLFQSCSLRPENIEVIAPRTSPLLLTLYRKYHAYLARRHLAPKKVGLRRRLINLLLDGRTRIERRLAIARNVVSALFWGSLLATLALIASIFKLAWSAPTLTKQLVSRVFRKSLGRVLPARTRPSTPAASEKKRESLGSRLYRLMEENEAMLISDLIGVRQDVAAWYSPTAFWPYFNQIAAPRLMCVPDVVLADFPVGFALVSGGGMQRNFDQVEKAIRGGEYFVTYSERTKWDTLVQRYSIDPDFVYVVRHGANRLDDLIRVTGFPDNEEATTTLCRKLLMSALQKDMHQAYRGIQVTTQLRFIFYASQFRPNKNVITLLRAYDHLLKRRFIGHKLILTGNLWGLEDVQSFIETRNLQNDVLCLHGLSEQELAACYRLADLAVNPSLSEGGCPFTFTEALSVGTPAVMSRIPVTEEVINDPALQELTLFDPYDWKDMAKKIEWALTRRDLLIARQMPFYNKLAQRTWRNVVDEYVAVLEQISSGGERTDDEQLQGFTDPGVRRTCA